MMRMMRGIRPNAMRYRPVLRLGLRGFGSSPMSAQVKAFHPFKHETQPSLSNPVSDHAMEDETKRSGLPDGQEASHAAPLADLPTPSLFSLANRTVIITGGGRGLGLTIVRAVLESGASVAAVDLLPEPSQPEWDSVKSYAESKGLDVSYTSLDVTDQSQISQVFQGIFDDAAKRQNQPVKGLFCAAGIQMLKKALDYDPAQIRKIIDVNLTGSFFCARAFAKEYISRNPSPAEGGYEGNKEPASILFTGSMSGHVANFGLDCAAYNASKAGVNQLARNLAAEWGKEGIRVNSLSPGYIKTAMTAALLDERPDLNETWLRGSLLGRLSTADEFRGPVVFLLSNASSFVTGADLLVDGGHTAT